MLKRIQVVFDAGRDADILRWLEGQENRSAAIREAIRAANRPQPALDVTLLRRVLREELAHLARNSVATAAAVPEPQSDVDGEAAAWLDAMF